MTQIPTPENQPELPNPQHLGDIIPYDGEDADLLDMAAAADAEQPEFVQRYAERRALGETAVDPLTLLELQGLEAANGQNSHSQQHDPAKGKVKEFVHPRTAGDMFSEAHVDYLDALDVWNVSDKKLKDEASMRTKELHKLHPGEHGEPEVYASELENLRLNFGSPKPKKPTRSE